MIFCLTFSNKNESASARENENENENEKICSILFLVTKTVKGILPNETLTSSGDDGGGGDDGDGDAVYK